MREDNVSASKDRVGGNWKIYQEATYGFKNYWYPVLEARKLRRKPRSVTVCGETIALFRDRGSVRALNDRCPHRGIPLSRGRREFPGTVSCVYHGWTYRLEDGELVAALTDGPDSPICGKASVRVRNYPVAEKAGLIWVYIGDEPVKPLEEDIPEELLRDDLVVEPMVELRSGDWRYGMENAVDESHAKYLHRYTPYYLIYKFPSYQTDVKMEPDESGKWLVRSSVPVFSREKYPGLGVWPRREIWRSSKGLSVKCAARMPSTFLVGHDGWNDYQVFVPAGDDSHLAVFISAKQTKSLFGRLAWHLRYWIYIRFIHHIVLNRWEDQTIVQLMNIPPERLFRPDVSISGWRKWASEQASGVCQGNPANGSEVGDPIRLRMTSGAGS